MGTFFSTGIVLHSYQQYGKVLCLHYLAYRVCGQTFGFFPFQYFNPVLLSSALLGKAKQLLTNIHSIDLIRLGNIQWGCSGDASEQNLE